MKVILTVGYILVFGAVLLDSYLNDDQVNTNKAIEQLNYFFGR